MNAHYLGLFGEKTRSQEDREFFRKKYNIPVDGKVLVCIAFDEPFKGIDLLVEAFQIIYSKYKNVYLLSVGVDIQKSRLPDRAVQMGVADRIRWAGVVDEGWKLLSAADIYVQPSRAQEGLPLAIMEAMAMKLPIVSTNISGNIEAVADGKNGLVCEPTKEHIAAAIEKLLLQPAVWEKMGEAGYRIFKEHFDGETSVRKLIEKYYGVMSFQKS
jgi:glycosyltransferase involved in cell wall biosynthesis